MPCLFDRLGGHRSLLAFSIVIVAPLLLAPGPVRPSGPVLAPNVVTTGSLAPGTDVLPDGQYTSRFTINAGGGETYRVWLASEDFDAMLYLYAPNGQLVGTDDDGWEGTNAALTFTAEMEGSFELFATSYSAGAVGTFYVLLGPGGEYAPAAEPLSDGAASERLADTDSIGLESGNTSDYYELTAVPLGQMVTLTLRSAAFDAELYVVDSDGLVVLHDDDSAGGRDATLSFPWTPAPDQRWFAVVTSSEPGARGGYFLERTGPGSAPAVAAPPPQPPANPPPNAEPPVAEPPVATPPTNAPPIVASPTPTTPPVTVAATEPSLLLDHAIAEQLTDTDGTGRRAGPVDAYQLQLDAATLIKIDATSDDIDTYLQVYDGRGGLVGEDDDAGRGTNSRFVAELPAGEYTVEVSSFDGSQLGAYELAATPTTWLDEPDDIGIGDEIDARWTVRHPRDASGHSVALYGFHARRSRTLTILLRPDDSDVFCRAELEQENGRYEADSILLDDGCVVVADVRSGEDYLVRAIGTRGEDDEGFLLAVTAQEPAIEWTTIELSRDVRGHINWSTAFTDWNAPGAGFRFELSRGEEVDITVRQTDLDARVFITDMDGRVLLSNADTRRLSQGGGVSFEAPRSGWYRLIVTGRQRWFDSFTLRVSRRR